MENNFNLDLETYEFTLTKEGSTESYELTELTGKQRDSYMNQMSKNMQMIGDNYKIKSFDGLQANLLCLCIKHTSGAKADTHVTKDHVQSWPSRVQKAIFDKAQQMSGLNEDEDNPGNE